MRVLSMQGPGVNQYLSALHRRVRIISAERQGTMMTMMMIVELLLIMMMWIDHVFADHCFGHWER